MDGLHPRCSGFSPFRDRMRSTWPSPCNLSEFRLISQQNTSSRCVHVANDSEALDWTPLHRATPDPKALDFNEALKCFTMNLPGRKGRSGPPLWCYTPMRGHHPTTQFTTRTCDYRPWGHVCVFDTTIITPSRGD